MLSFVQNWLSPRINPIGVDFGSDCLRLAQVQLVGSEYRLLAAACADVPAHVRNDMSARLAFFVETTRDLLAQANFRGRQAVLALPISSMFIQHLRLPKMDDAALVKALPWELRGKLPIDPSAALMRHLVAGEVYQDQEPRNEVIVMAAARELVNQLLLHAAKARLDVVGMNVEPKALVDCFGHIYRRKTDQDVTNCFVDIGCTATRAVIARNGEILFARAIPIGGEHLNRAVADALKIGLADAKVLRLKLCHLEPALDERRQRQEIHPNEQASGNAAGFALLDAAMQKARGATTVVEKPRAAQSTPRLIEPDPDQQLRAVEAACQQPLAKLIDELEGCRRYHEATFPNKPVDRLIFVGGEARQRGLCQTIAREMALTAQVGDPLVRMGRVSEVGIESGIDRRQPQPAWAVPIGLSLGPTPSPKAEASP